VAYLYGYRASPDRPERRIGVPLPRDNAMHAFYQAIAEGRVPAPDAKEGGAMKWFHSTIEADFAARKKKGTGRPMKTRGAA
jgi:hypothetical protein